MEIGINIMKIVNNITNTEPLILHAYGASHVGNEWAEMCDNTIGLEIKVPDEVTIISFFFGDKNFPLKEQLSVLSIPFIDATENNYFFIWQDRVKIKLISEAIKKVKTKYVLVLDGTDVLLGNSVDKIIEKFILFDCKLLYNACVISHALSFDRASDETKGVGIFNKLNTGAFIGETCFVEEFYKDVMTIYDNVDMPAPHTDGIRVGLKYKNYSEIKVDYNCEIFQTLLGVKSTFKEGILTISK